MTTPVPLKRLAALVAWHDDRARQARTNAAGLRTGAADPTYPERQRRDWAKRARTAETLADRHADTAAALRQLLAISTEGNEDHARHVA